jgi:hypothetical protein
VHTCKKEGCNRPSFGGGYCAYDQYIRRMSGGDLFKRKAPVKPINKVAKKRREELKTYKQISQELWDEASINKTNKCFFCDEWMGKKENVHHLIGRTNLKLIDKKFMVLCHNKCHVYGYHQLNYEQLIKQDWYEGFLLRLKSISEELWNKELKKRAKSDNELDFKRKDEFLWQ